MHLGVCPERLVAKECSGSQGLRPPDPLPSGGLRRPHPPKSASRRFAPAVESLETREVLDPGFNVPDGADWPLAIQIDSWVHGILDSGPRPQEVFVFIA